MYLRINKTKKTLLIFFVLLLSAFTISIFAKDNNGKNIFLDSDQDGLSDAEERMYRTDPNNPDTDGDGYSDGTEIKSGYNPLKPAPGDKIIGDNEFKIKQKKYQNNVEIDNDLEEQEHSDKNLTEEISVKLASVISDNNKDVKSVTMDDINNQ